MRLCKECGIKERPKGRATRYCIDCAVKVKRRKHRIADHRYAEKHRERVIISRRRRDKEMTAKVRYSRYRSSEKYREHARLRYKSTLENVRKAHYYVTNALRDGKIIRSKLCENCRIKDMGEKRSTIEAHHYKGYEPENWLNVQWLCTPCHKRAEEVFLGS